MEPIKSFSQASVFELINHNFKDSAKEKVTQYATKQFAEGVDSFTVCEEIIQRFDTKKIHHQVAHFERELALIKQQRLFPPLKEDFLLHDNQVKLEKWKGYGISEELFYLDAEFVDFFFEASLGSQMKISKNKELKDENGQLMVLVSGEWMTSTQFLQNFEVRYDKVYDEKFIFHRETHDVYTFTGIGKGIVPFHPYKTGLHEPITKIEKSDYDTTLEMARKFRRVGEESLTSEEFELRNSERTYVLQIVSSRVDDKKKHNCLVRNLRNVIDRKHPWIRLVGEPEGDEAKVYAAGFGWSKKPGMPLRTITGRFRSIDPWEYQNAKKVVTNIAVTKEEFEKLQKFPDQFAQEGVGFNLMNQNCSVGVRTAISEATGIEVPTELNTVSLIEKVAPDFIRNPLDKIRSAFNKMGSLIGRVTPNFIKTPVKFVAEKIKHFYLGIWAFRLALLGILLGHAEVHGEGKEMGVKEGFLKSKLSKLRYWFDIKMHTFHLPGILQEWQEQQPSTVIYEKGYKGFPIVPM